MGTEVWEGSITISESWLFWPQRLSEWEESQPMPQLLHSAPTDHTLYLLVTGDLTPYSKSARVPLDTYLPRLIWVSGRCCSKQIAFPFMIIKPCNWYKEKTRWWSEDSRPSITSSCGRDMLCGMQLSQAGTPWRTEKRQGLSLPVLSKHSTRNLCDLILGNL